MIEERGNEVGRVKMKGSIFRDSRKCGMRWDGMKGGNAGSTHNIMFTSSQSTTWIN